MPKSDKTFDNLMRSQFSSVTYVPALIPKPIVETPPEIPTIHRSCEYADIDGADAILATLVSVPVVVLVVVDVVVLVD